MMLDNFEIPDRLNSFEECVAALLSESADLQLEPIVMGEETSCPTFGFNDERIED